MLVYSTVPGCHFLLLRVTLRNTFPGTRRLVHKHTFYICIDTPLFFIFLNPRAVGDTIKAKLVPLPRVSVGLPLYAYAVVLTDSYPRRPNANKWGTIEAHKHDRNNRCQTSHVAPSYAPALQ